MNEDKLSISPEMTLLETVKRYRGTVDVFKSYDEVVGECVICKGLFDPIQVVADRYGLDLDRLLQELEQAASQGK